MPPTSRSPRRGELSAAANLEQMNAKLDQAAAEWKRAQELFANKLIAQVDYDTAKANYEVAKANVSVANSGVAQAQADLEKAQRNLDFCTINSPVSGVIIDRRVNIGQTVVASLNAPSLFLIARDLTKMQIWVGGQRGRRRPHQTGRAGHVHGGRFSGPRVSRALSARSASTRR